MEREQELLKKISELERQLELTKSNHVFREKIENMSSEVIDSNPYR